MSNCFCTSSAARIAVHMFCEYYYYKKDDCCHILYIVTVPCISTSYTNATPTTCLHTLTTHCPLSLSLTTCTN